MASRILTRKMIVANSTSNTKKTSRAVIQLAGMLTLFVLAACPAKNENAIDEPTINDEESIETTRAVKPFRVVDTVPPLIQLMVKSSSDNEHEFYAHIRSAAAYDLNDDGKDDYFVVAEGFCGTGGCSDLIFIAEDNKFREVTNGGIWGEPTILPVVTEGYNALRYVDTWECKCKKLDMTRVTNDNVMEACYKDVCDIIVIGRDVRVYEYHDGQYVEVRNEDAPCPCVDE